jgi:hypothetical protein
MILTSDRNKSFDIFYPEVATINQTLIAGVKLQTLFVTNSGVFRPYSKSKFRFASYDFVSMDFNQEAASNFSNHITVDVTLDYQTFNYSIEFTYECRAVNLWLTHADFEVTVKHYNGTYLVPEKMTCQNNAA